LIQALRRWVDSDVGRSFFSTPSAWVAAVVALVCLVSATFAPWVAPHNPFDLATLDLTNVELPPAWMEAGSKTFFLGTDDQGRDVFSAILYGSRISLAVGFISMLSFPPILVALLIAGVGRALLPGAEGTVAFGVLILAITLTGWVQYARTVRGSTLVERQKEYVQAARVIGVSPLRIMRRHVLPNVLGPVLVLATIQVATAIITEATLSFLGVGVPPTSPSLGTLIRTGNDFLFSGSWWITVFPGAMLVLIALSVNLLGDWLRDALNPRLQ